jgi:TolB protein
MNADGSGLRHLSEARPSQGRLEWSPDGRKIVFGGHNEIYVINGDGSGLQRLTRTPTANQEPAWSPGQKK